MLAVTTRLAPPILTLLVKKAGPATLAVPTTKRPFSTLNWTLLDVSAITYLT